MKTRKIVLLSAIAALLCVYVVQLATSARGAVRDIKLADKPDTIVIEQGGSSVTLVQDSGEWVMGDRKYPADSGAAKEIADAVSDVKVLETVAKTGDESALARYGLDAGKTITVKALKGGKELRSLTLGKEASTASQTYLTLNGGRDIYLAAGSLRGVFGKSADELRSAVVYDLKYDDVSAVRVSSPQGDWALQKAGSPAVWALAPRAGAEPGAAAAVALDADKAAAWVKSITSLSVGSWLDDGVALPAAKPTTIAITAGGKDITVAIYPAAGGGKGKDKDKDQKFLCTSSATPYKFSLAAYSAQQFMTKLSELAK